MSKINPLGERILVKRQEAEEVTRGGIVLPDTAKEKPQKGEVLEVGHGKLTAQGKKVPLEVNSGDTVIFGKYAGTQIEFQGEEYIILKESEVLAVLN